MAPPDMVEKPAKRIVDSASRGIQVY